MGVFAFAFTIFAAGVAHPAAAVDGAGLEGSWASACEPMGKNGRHGLVTRVTFDGDRIEAEAQMYATTACQTPTFKLNYVGRATMRRDIGGKLALDQTVRTISLTPQAADVVTQYNQDGDPGCGLRGWQLNVERSVAGRRCAPFVFPGEGTMLYDAIWLDGDSLRFGFFPMLWSNISVDMRPTRPLPTAYRRVAD